MIDNLENEIIKLKKEKKATILAHYYQNEDIQDIADFIGDSLDLSRRVTDIESDIIVFCGVKFMAEVAKILSPNKKVLIPDLNAGCSLEESCKFHEFKRFKEKYEDHIVITYINCSAEIKSLSDIIVTSSNAERIINQIPKNQKIIFAPDKHLGSYISRITKRDMVLWPGTCIVHEQFSEKELIKLTTRYPEAKVISHPECPENLLQLSNHIGSTSSLLNFVKNNQGKEFIILTEQNIIHQMKKINPTGRFYSCLSVNQSGCVLCSTCPYMELNTMEKLYNILKYEKNEIFLKEELIESAKKPLIKMLSM